MSVTAEELIDRRDAILHGYIEQGLIETVAYANPLVEMLYEMCPLALCTSDSKRNAKKKLEGPDFWQKFQVIVTASDTRNHKPHSEPYQMTVNLLRVDPENVVVVEDNPAGVISARGVKPKPCKVIAFPNGYTAGMEKEMKSAGADEVVYSLKDITPKMLDELFSEAV